MKIYVGYIKTATSEDEEFEFEVPDDATEEDVACAAEAALWGSSILDLWWVAKEAQGNV